MAAGDLFQAASDLRDACLTLLGDDAPATSYVRNGFLVMDREDQLVVYVPRFESWVGVATDRQAPQIQQIAGPNRIAFLVAVTRCADAASPSQQEAVAERCYSDVWILWNGLRRLIGEGVLFTGPVEPGPEPMVTPTAVVNEQGNVTGWTLGVQCTLAGYDPRT